jgi:hypothetical protein
VFVNAQERALWIWAEASRIAERIDKENLALAFGGTSKDTLRQMVTRVLIEELETFAEQLPHGH